jgi:hypothetical protein
MAPDTHLLQILVPGTRVLIWTHTRPLDLHTPGLATVDYLLDGLVAGHLNSRDDVTLDHVVFSHPQFGDSFWVAFVNIEQVIPTNFMAALNAVLPSSAAVHAALYTSGNLSSQWDKALRGTFAQLDVLTIAQ